MSNVEHYRELSRRENTTKSYADSVRHFEVEWKGLLPASSETIAQYLADIAPLYATSTLRTRLAGLAQWHIEQGFVDPTKAPVVREVLKGIRRVHTVPLRQAKPLQLAQLEKVNAWLETRLSETPVGTVEGLRLSRDRAMLLVGFWRGFRSDELTRLRVEHVQATEDKGLRCFLPSSKTDRESTGRTFHCPSLSRLCPVEAYQSWIKESQLSEGPVFRAIDRWGKVSESSFASKSVIRWLRELLESAGIDDADQFSSHSLRRGFASWARESGWDLKDLMTFVGWKDIQSAMKYLDESSNDFQAKLEDGLSRTKSAEGRGESRSRPKSSEARSNVIQLRRSP